MEKLRLITFITLALLLVMPPSIEADYVSDQKQTLRGIEALLIVIGPLPPEVTKLGLTKEQLRAEVESKVTVSGITIVPLEAFPTLDPYLLVTITTAYTQPYLSYSLSIALKQLVYLGRNKDISCDATTWTRKKAGISGKATIKSDVMENIHYLVESFLNDYSAVNHKDAALPSDDGGGGEQKKSHRLR